MSHVLVCWSVLPLLPPCLLFTSHTTGFHHYHIKCPARTAQPVYYCFAHWLILVTKGYRSNLVKVDYYVYENLSDDFEFSRPWQLVFVVQHLKLLEWVVNNPSQPEKFDLYQYFGNIKLKICRESFVNLSVEKVFFMNDVHKNQFFLYLRLFGHLCGICFSVMLLHKSKDW